ncbi:MAG: transporter substrate-binding domain-containing protein [Chloroflexota bacterium]
MARSHLPLGRAALIPIAACSLVFAGGMGAVAQSPDASAGASAAAATIGPECAKDQLSLKNPGRLTLSTDNPAYPPWWSDADKPADSDWELGYPPNGQGYEGATAAAVAAALGFSQDEIDWIPNTVFENAFAPGTKPFDWHMAQISITPERSEAVDFSDSYFDSHQALVALDGSVAAGATSIADLKDKKLGAAVGTTSLAFIENVIQPTQSAQVFNDNAALVQALQNGQIDGLVADIYSAIYMRDVQLTGASLVGSFSSDQQVDQMGMVLEKGSALTACVNEALAVIKSDGTLQSIYDTYIGGGEGLPVLQ